MYKYKQILGSNLLYTDTDSIFTTKPLSDEFIGTGLGDMKLEYTGSEAVFIAPKVYAINLSLPGTDPELLAKVKGSKAKAISLLTMDDFKDLLIKDSVCVIPQEKWYKKARTNTIHIKQVIYSLSVTENKRKLIYKNNILVDTEPFVIKESH